MIVTKFCYVCKSHVDISAKDHKEADKQFFALGHDDRKVSKLLPGICGVSGKATFS